LARPDTCAEKTGIAFTCQFFYFFTRSRCLQVFMVFFLLLAIDTINWLHFKAL
jgi:hypothetical protein